MVKQIQLELQTTLKRYLPSAHESYPIEPGLRIRDLLKLLGIPEYEVNLIYINGGLGNLDTTVKGGERVVLYPPLGGG